jgi:hypothetical protein
MLNSIVQSQVSQGKAAATSRVNKIAAKTQVKYATVFVLLLAAIAAFGFFDFEVHMYFFYCVQVYALLMGILHLWQMGKRFGWRNQYSFYQKLNLSVIVLLVAMAMQAIIIYFCKPMHDLFIIFPFSLLLFLFPLLAVSTYEYAIAIPKTIYKTWRYPENMNMPDMDRIDFSNSYIVSFLLRKNPKDISQSVMKFKAPLDRITFGEFFYLCMFVEYNEKNREKPVQYLNDNQQSYQWLFHVKPQRWWPSRRYIDPSLTIRENKINENFVIVSERVS